MTDTRCESSLCDKKENWGRFIDQGLSVASQSLDPLFRNSHCNATLSKREVAIDVRWEDVRIKTVDV